MGGGGDTEIKETAAEIEASKVAVEQWNLYNEELKQFEDDFMQRVDNFNSASNMADAKAAVDLSYNREYGNARTATANNLASAGVDPTSGKFQGALSDLTLDQSIKQGDTVNRAQVNEQDKYVVGKQDVVAIGMGQKAEGLAGMESSASLAQSKAANDAYTNFNNSASMNNAIGTAAGMGLAYYTRPDAATTAANTNFVSDSSKTLTQNQVYNPQAKTYFGGR